MTGLATVVLVTWTGTASALTFNVLTKDDKADAVIDGVCADVDGKCTLRAAIQEANANPGEDIINIIGAKDQKFVLKSAHLDAHRRHAERQQRRRRPDARAQGEQPGD